MIGQRLSLDGVALASQPYNAQLEITKYYTEADKLRESAWRFVEVSTLLGLTESYSDNGYVLYQPLISSSDFVEIMDAELDRLVPLPQLRQRSGCNLEHISSPSKPQSFQCDERRSGTSDDD